MQSHSRSHLYPTFNHLAAGGKLSVSLDQDAPASAEQLRLWSYQKPTLTAGSYILLVSQEITLPSGESTTLTTPEKGLRVSKPKFRLADPADLNRVHPAPGHSAYSRTLANVVFSHATTPWEKEISIDKASSFNKLSSMAVLTFAEDELVTDPKIWRDLGFTTSSEKPSEFGSIETKASRLVHPECTIKSALNSEGANPDFNSDDDLSLLLLDSKLFKSIFMGEDKTAWDGTADLSSFSFMASTQENTSGFTAALFADDNSDAHKPQFSVIVSPRTGPPGITSPKRVVSHLISMEDLDKIKLPTSDATNQYVGVVSLHAWEWTSVPESAENFAKIMIKLGENVAPLQASQATDRLAGGPPEAIKWSKAVAGRGYVLKPHTDITGIKAMALIRGPLIPVRPDENPPKAFSLYGEGLIVIDKTTGIPDASYSSAWTLGRSIMMADRTLSASLLRLRGKIHSEAVRRAKAKALNQGGYSVLSSNKSYLETLENTVNDLQRVQDISGISKGNPARRWTRTGSDIANLPVMRLSKDTSYTHKDYDDEVQQVALHMFGYESHRPDGTPIPARDVDADAAAIRAWVIDRFHLAGIPLHNLVLDSEMLPGETIRTFCIDNHWIDCFVDGGLSLANHFARDDDAIRRAVKQCINKYLDIPLNGGTVPQLPRWGFFIRSIAVSAFPDLKIEAPLPPGAPGDALEVVYMQVLADDILICLLDRLPGEQELDYIRISQPHHQQDFSLGTNLSGSTITLFHRPIPKQTGKNVGDPIGQTFENDKSRHVYDFDTQMLRPSFYMDQYNEAFSGNDEIFTDKRNPSSLLATQLRATNLRLQLKVTNELRGDEPPSVSERWTKAAFKLSAGSRPESGSEPETTEKQAADSRAPPSNDMVLPTGPRLPIGASISPYAMEPRSGKEHTSPDTQPDPSTMIPYREVLQHVSCCLCYDPGNATNLIYATEMPTDPIFNLSAREESGYPAELELSIPVALSSGTYPDPVKDGSRGVMVIPGTASQADLPKLEDINSSRWWSYECRLETSSLYSIFPDALPKEGDIVGLEEEKQVMFIIKITPRFSRLLPVNMVAFKTSFILRGVRLLLPQSDPPGALSRHVRFDATWRSSSLDGETSVSTTRLTIQPAVVATLKEESVQYILQKQDLSFAFVLSQMPPSNARIRLFVTQQQGSEPFDESFDLWASPQPMSNGQGFLYTGSKNIPLDLFKVFLPLEMRLRIVEKDGGHALGPDTAPFVFPRLPNIDRLKGSSSFYWGTQHLSIIWPPLKGLEISLKRNFSLKIRKPQWPDREPIDVSVEDGNEIVRFMLSDLESRINGSKEFGLLIDGSVVVEHPRIRGTLVNWSVVLSGRPKIEANANPFFDKPRDFDPTAPMSNSQLASIRSSRGSHVQTDLFYWRSSGRSLGALTCRSPYVVNRYPGPQIDDSQPQLMGAGALTVLLINDDINSRNTMFKIVWVGNDGSVNVWSRHHEVEQEKWHSDILAPPGTASTLGGGLIVSCGERPVYRQKSFPDPVVWWLGPRGEVFGRRLLAGSERWIDVEPQASLPAGSIDVTSPNLKRPAQMATTWAYDSQYGKAVYLFWIRANGDLMVTCSDKSGKSRSKLSGTAIAYRDVDAAPGTSLTVSIGHSRTSPSSNNNVYVLWISTDGALCLGSRIDLVETTNSPEGWDTIIRISSPGTANPLSDICYIGNVRLKTASVVWADPDGKLQIAWAESLALRPSWSREESIYSLQNEWAAWGWQELNKWIPIGEKPIIGRVEPDDYITPHFVYFHIGGGKWYNYEVNFEPVLAFRNYD
ncbi:hypothetical protein BFJ71_g3529 [Fusarium oxysporum]|nr:hypothetical protein BFJ71_g3529 [Fusarium oxysporum]